MGIPNDQPPPFTPGSPPATTSSQNNNPPNTTTTTTTTTPADDPPPYDPPAYNARPDTTAPDPDAVLDPCTLAIHGRFIYPILPSGEPDSEPVYQLSRAIHEQGAAAERIEFQRLDLRIRNNNHDDPDAVAVAGPSLARRAKDVYWLEHRKPLPHAGIPFQAWLEPQTRKALGKMVVEKSPVFRHGYRAVKVVSDAEKRWLEREGKKVRKGEYYFVVKEGGGRDWEWSDAEGRAVAVQVREAVEGAEEVFRLRVLVPLARRSRDSLVALWCLWMWHIRIEENIPKRTWEDRKRIMQMPRIYPSPTPLGR